MKTADKASVAAQLKLTSDKMGVPLAVLSDQGTELKGGMELYRAEFSGARSPPTIQLR